MLQFNAAWLECDGWSWNSSTICLGPTVEIISMFGQSQKLRDVPTIIR
jgi:hypothetical protein